MISIVTPAFNESRNLPLLYERICATMESLGLDWEWIVVDDHSSDDTFAVINRLAERDRRVRGVRFARNFGAHTAVTCGLHQARGDCVAALAADLQDPPEVLPQLLEQWRAGVKVVWAARGAREGERAATLGFSRLYYWVMRSVVGIKEMPATGADFFLMDRAVVDAFSRFSESNSSILALITWMGFRQATITYDKGARVHGRSAWTLKKKLKLVVDSVTAFSYVPDPLHVVRRLHGRVRGLRIRGTRDPELPARRADRRLVVVDRGRAGARRHPDGDDGRARRVPVARAGRVAAPAPLHHRGGDV